MQIKRDLYLNRLIARIYNGMIKVITGVRCCGKSYLLFNLFYKYLINKVIDDNHIIRIALDERVNKELRDPDSLCDYIHQKR